MEDDNDKKLPAKDSSSKDRMRKELDTLQRELEIAEYATTETGQYRRKTPRAVSLVRTKKRKMLEKSDAKELAMQVEDVGKRMRGSQVALRNEVIHGSRMFTEENDVAESDADVSEAEEVEEVIDESDRYEQLGGAGDDAEEDENNDDEDEAYEEEGDEAEVQEDEEDYDEEAVEVDEVAAKKKSTKKKAQPAKRKKRLVYRMRNFKSARMAERHGDALGAHARGQSLAAVRKLELVANDAPTAPQVYSSLGMVYESLLSDSRKKKTRPVPSQEAGDEATVPIGDEDANEKSIEQQLELAKKAYGSYHVAAVLCKKDYTLWVRAGDTAKQIADLYTEAMEEDVEDLVRDEYRKEKQIWAQEAKKDYSTADNLKPPGIDVPAKLAAAQMELGNLSEALTILTDLKNRGAPSDAAVDEADGENGFPRRTEFERSYKAWLLYADLMLRIGHECTQWNKGEQHNKNYMFRRWLRKFSNIFDWQERRLQALSLALEAAAGSKSCENLILWAKERASKVGKGGSKAASDERCWNLDSYEMTESTPGPEESKNNEETGLDDVERMNEHDDSGETGEPDSSYTGQQASSLDRTREALLLKNRLELQVFDHETTKLNLPTDSEASRERGLARSALIESHRKSVVDLIGDYLQHQAAFENVIASYGNDGSETAANPTEPLPISGSCATVCSIASELMKHCLILELYRGGRLVGEAVSSYLKERAVLLEKRLEANRSFDQRQKSTDEAVLLQFETYDEVEDDESEDDEFDMPYLSDDEVILESSEKSLVKSLNNGILPPELRVLFALSLIGEGGRAFLARKCISAIEAIKDDDMNEKMKDPIDTGIVKDPAWHSFRLAMTEPLCKTSALVFVVNVLQKTNKESEWADLLAPLLQKYLERLESEGILDNAILNDGDSSKQASLTRAQVYKIILAFARMQVDEAKSVMLTQKQVASDTASSVLEQLTPLIRECWKIEKDGSIPPLCVEGLSIVAKAFDILATMNENDAQAVQGTIGQLLTIISMICGADIPDPFQSKSSDAETLSKEWTGFPIPATWQTSMQQIVSRRFYNLVIGCNVALFSGWETAEFSLDLMKQNEKASNSRHFGVDIRGNRVTGYVSPETETELADQWRKLGTLLPQLPEVDFEGDLSKAKETAWYAEVTKDSDSSRDTVAVYGEKDGFALFLALSRLCLDAASSASGTAEDDLIKLAVSVMMPISEFCLDKFLWNSSLGKAAISTSTAVADWSSLARSAGSRQLEVNRPRRAVEANRPRQVAEANRPRQVAEANRPRQASATTVVPWSARKARPLPSMVKIPVSALLTQWREGRTDSNRTVDKEQAQAAMRQVDVAVKQLRACYTEAALQRSSIQVALALLDLVIKELCSNPFLCLQQAAMFASNGAKGGNNDEHFKEGLPVDRECTPQEALVIIGRADCLQCLQFPDEAIYLCSYVARVCRLHRDRQEPELPWNAQWRVISILAYNLSVAIRTTQRQQADRSGSRIDYWENSVVEELQRGRGDALAVKKSLTQDGAIVDDDAGGGDSSEEDNFENVIHDEEDDEDGQRVDDYDEEGDDEMLAQGTIPMHAMFSNTAVELSSDDDDNGNREFVAV